MPKPFKASTEVFDPTKDSHRRQTVVGAAGRTPGLYKLAIHPEDTDYRGGITTRIFDIAGRDQAVQVPYEDYNDLYERMKQKGSEFIRYCQTQRSNLMIKRMGMLKLKTDNPDTPGVVMDWQFELIDEELRRYEHLDQSPFVAFQWTRYHVWGDLEAMEAGANHTGYIDEVRFRLFKSVADIDKVNAEVQPEKCRPMRNSDLVDPQYLPKWVRA